MTEPAVLIDRRETIWTITLNRPRVMNALHPDMIDGLRAAVDELLIDQTAKVVILTGAGGNFCSGADLSFFLADLKSPQWLESMQRLGRVILDLRALPQPIITKLRGAAVGGGANLALAGDLVVAADTTRFRENFIHIGLTLDAGGTYYLPRLVGLAKARELAFLGEEINGRAGADMGLFYKSVPDDQLDAEVAALAERLALAPRAVLSAIKEGLEESLNMTMKQVLERESAYQAILLRQPEHLELVKTFLRLKGLEV